MTGELLTVKEYAAHQGMTEQAAYKQIRAGKLLTVERQENGKAKKYIFVFAQGVQDAPCAAAGAPDQQPGADQLAAVSDPPQPPAAEARPEPPRAPAQDQTAAAGQGRPQPSRRALRILPARPALDAARARAAGPSCAHKKVAYKPPIQYKKSIKSKEITL